MREAAVAVEVRVGAVMEGGVVNRTFLVEVVQSVMPCVGVTEVVCGTSTGITDCTGITEGSDDGEAEGVRLGAVTRVTEYSLDGDSDLTIEKGGSGSPLAEVSSSGK